MTSSQTVPAMVAAYAESVRRELDDLAAADVDDLTEGLEADLMEQFQESGAVPALSPMAYAAELRSSAGLPERNASGAANKGPGLRDSFRKAGVDFLARVRANPASNAVLEFFIKLRPVWWLLRAWAIFQIVVIPFNGKSFAYVPRGFAAWAFLLLLTVLSVHWGSRPKPQRAWLRRTLWTANALSVALIIMILPGTAFHLLTTPNNPPSDYNSGYIPPLSVNGASVEHVFVYDKDGHLLRDVRFYDQDGHPLDMPLPDGLTAPDQLPADLAPGEPFEPHPDPYNQAVPSTQATAGSPTPSPTATESGSPAPSSSAAPTASTPAGKASPVPTVSGK
ncbi:hypothetical protein BIU82_02870 [Arthrobacter sp. SW1]|uniref:hypothetical protein n=1 Tax=Arthrobacter sp. SW1 TaxID=1920889 RepID=UPI000877E47B|nr:hypothetical protein [Arthrobacter sp. SW1]OFI39990.1 hypothetical protein BIU82_02870 [Arthrobacter sp. SW1]